MNLDILFITPCSKGKTAITGAESPVRYKYMTAALVYFPLHETVH
jgi:hypothetical protein